MPREERYVVIEGATVADPERKVMVIKTRLSEVDREWIRDGRSFAVRLSDGKVTTVLRDRIHWRRDVGRATAVYRGTLVVAEALARGDA